MTVQFTYLAIPLTLAYPFIVYFSLQQIDARWLLLLVLLIVTLRWLGARSRVERGMQLGIALLLVTAAGFGYDVLGLKAYPVLINIGLLVIFSLSLLHPPTIVERVARLREPELDHRGVAYTRRVTQVWCVFFIVNGSLSLWTAVWGSEQIWLLYNGFVAYLLMGLLFAIEWMVRQRLKVSRNG